MIAMKTEDITTHAAIAHFQQIDFENGRLREELERMRGSHYDSQKFYGIIIGVEVAATLHNVHADTIRKYANLGLIPRHPDSSDAKMLFRVSDILLLDFKRLRKDAQFLPYHK